MDADGYIGNGKWEGMTALTITREDLESVRDALALSETIFKAAGSDAVNKMTNALAKIDAILSVESEKR